MDSARLLLRHTLATVAYRAAKTVRGAPPTFPNFRAGENVRTPLEILAHIGDLLDWALTFVQGQEVWRQSLPQSWEEDIARFHSSLGALDDFLASPEPMSTTPEILFQGPIADTLAHIGQLAMLRRLAKSPIRGEAFTNSRIVRGNLGADQPKSDFEFD